MAEHDIIFCETSVSICPVVSFFQFAVAGSKLVTIIGELHDGVCDQNAVRPALPSNGIAVGDYILNTLRYNSSALAFLEVGSDICHLQMKDYGSRPIRELACALPENDPQVIRVDVRNTLLGTKNKDFLYCANLTYSNGPLAPDKLEKYFIWKHGSLLKVAKDLVKKKDHSILQGPLNKVSTPLLAKLDKEVDNAFVELKKAVKTYTNNVAVKLPPTYQWWMTNIVIPMKKAWAMVLDFFILYNIFVETDHDELVIILGIHHVENIVPRLNYANEVVSLTKSHVSKGENCAKPSNTQTQAWGVVSVTQNICEDIRTITSRKRPYSVF